MCLLMAARRLCYDSVVYIQLAVQKVIMAVGRWLNFAQLHMLCSGFHVQS
jgi:hypothetical protein